MPNETQLAVNWALTQQVTVGQEIINITKDTKSELVDKIREYFNTNNIVYSTFSYDDLEPFLN